MDQTCESLCPGSGADDAAESGAAESGASVSAGRAAGSGSAEKPGEGGAGAERPGDADAAEPTGRARRGDGETADGQTTGEGL